MYICICHEVTDREIKHAANNGASSIKDLRESLNVGMTCGRCADCAKGLLKECLGSASQLELQVS